jgi:hypothetical protein
VTSEAHTGCSKGSMSEQKQKKRICETSSSSLKSKRIRCSNDAGHCQDINQNDMDDNNIGNTPEFGKSADEIPIAPSVRAHVETKISEIDKAFYGIPAIMLMNIADEQTKARLSEVVFTISIIYVYI